MIGIFKFLLFPFAPFSIDPDLKATVYCWGIKNATEATWDIVWNRFLAANLASEENVLLSSLACSQNATILNKYYP